MLLFVSWLQVETDLIKVFIISPCSLQHTNLKNSEKESRFISSWFGSDWPNLLIPSLTYYI